MRQSFKPGVRVEQQMRVLIADATSVKKMRIEQPQPGTLVIVKRYVSGWIILLVILFIWAFLLSLLLLLIKSEKRTTIIGHDVEGGSQWTISGAVPFELRWFLKREFPDAGL